MFAFPIILGSLVEAAMAGTDFLAPGNAIPPVDKATRALEARRSHHRQIIRRAIIAAPIVAIVGLLCLIGPFIAEQLRAGWRLKTAGFHVDWQIDQDDWLSGGVTEVSYRALRATTTPDSLHSDLHDPDLKILTSLRNVESLNLSDCEVTEQGLASISGLSRLRKLYLSRLGQLRYSSPDVGLSDACLIPVQSLSQLRILTLSGNRITDAGLAMIAHLPNLEELDLDATDVTDAGLVQLQGLKKLMNLSLGGTLATPQGVKSLQSALPALQINSDINPEIGQILKEWRRVKR
jgi:hypothetical protein